MCGRFSNRTIFRTPKPQNRNSVRQFRGQWPCQTTYGVILQNRKSARLRDSRFYPISRSEPGKLQPTNWLPAPFRTQEPSHPIEVTICRGAVTHTGIAPQSGVYLNGVIPRVFPATRRFPVQSGGSQRVKTEIIGIHCQRDASLSLIACAVGVTS